MVLDGNEINKTIINAIRNAIPDRMYISIMYRYRMGKRLNLKDPKTYNEKLQWMKLNYHIPEYSLLVDKEAVKRKVAEIIGQEYIIPTLGVWTSFDDIDFESLPNQFVLKCTHDSGGIVICTDKRYFNMENARRTINKSMKTNYYKLGREWPYKNVVPRIIAEQYMEDYTTKELRDYKFFCFDGNVKYLFVASDRQKDEDTKFDFFDADYNHLRIIQGHPNASVTPKRPKNFEQMKILAEKLSANMPHVRVDFYEVNGKIYFGELTFYHHGGWTPFDPEEWDRIFGDCLVLPSVQK